MSGPSPNKPALAGAALALMTALCIGGIALLWQALQPRIEANSNAERLKALKAVLGEVEYSNDLLATEISYEQTRIASVRILKSWRAWRGPDEAGGQTAATVIEAEADNGYSGPIRMLVGIDAADRLIAVRVTGHSETPGLGDQIDRARSAWVDQFAAWPLGGDSGPQWRIRQDGGEFDKISGATVTSRSMVQTLALIGQWRRRNLK